MSFDFREGHRPTWDPRANAYNRYGAHNVQRRLPARHALIGTTRPRTDLRAKLRHFRNTRKDEEPPELGSAPRLLPPIGLQDYTGLSGKLRDPHRFHALNSFAYLIRRFLGGPRIPPVARAAFTLGCPRAFFHTGRVQTHEL